jgi:hypothetical protein
VSAGDRDFERRLERAWFTLREAEDLGVRFRFSLEADYPPGLPPSCVRDLQDAIGAHRVLITRMLMERAGVAA